MAIFTPFRHASPRGGKATPSGDRSSSFWLLETALGMQTVDFYRDFGARVEALRLHLVTLLKDLKAQGSRLLLWGFSKGEHPV
jgi:hypothetical protein